MCDNFQHQWPYYHCRELGEEQFPVVPVVPAHQDWQSKFYDSVCYRVKFSQHHCTYYKIIFFHAIQFLIKRFPSYLIITAHMLYIRFRVDAQVGKSFNGR